MIIDFRVHAEPVGKGRPRATNKDGWMNNYTPKRTKEFEDIVRYEFISQIREEKPVFKADTALNARVIIAQTVPRSYPKKLREKCLAHKVVPTKKPDIDNVLKAVFDALNGFAYEDDKQIVQVYAWKVYAEEGHVDVRIWPSVFNEEE